MAAALKEHKNCCRLCLAHIGHRKAWKITEKTQQNFFKVTNVELKLSDKYSNRTCKTCSVLLFEASFYQQNLINIQKKLYSFEDEVEQEAPSVAPKIENFVSIKQEPMDESDHSQNYIPDEDDDDRAFSDFEAPPAQDSDSDDYFATSDKKTPAAKSKIAPAVTSKKTPPSKSKSAEAGTATKSDVPGQTVNHGVKEEVNDSDSDDYPLKPKIVKKKEVPKASFSTARANRYTDEQLEEAVRAVVEDGRRLTVTAKEFNIPSTTLARRIKQGPSKRTIAKMIGEKVPKRIGYMKTRPKGALSTDPMFCDLCNFSTFSKNDLIVHMNLRHKAVSYDGVIHKALGLKPPGYYCRKCNATFSDKNELKKHREDKHYKYYCPRCSIEFENRRLWARHMVRHRRFYTCEVCGDQVQSHRYKDHIESHKSERPLCTATDCEKNFTSKAALEFHLTNFHAKPETFGCEICGNSYDSAKKLRRHLERVHATPNICCTVPGCNYRSTRKEYVAMHMAKHKDIDEFTKAELIRVFKATRIKNMDNTTQVLSSLE